MTDRFETSDGEPLPDRVREQVAPAAEWPDEAMVAPDRVGRPVIAGNTKLYHVVDRDGVEVFMDESGHTYGQADRFEPLGASIHSCEYALDPRLTHVHPDTKMEHVVKVIIATPRGVFRHYSRSGVAWSYLYAVRDGLDPDDLTDDMLALAESLADAPSEYKPDRPSSWEKLTDSAWHSSMESSSFAEKVNDITRGDAHAKLDWSFPVVVRFGDTRNVCSQPFSIYAPTMHANAVVDAFVGSYGIGRTQLTRPPASPIGGSSTNGTVFD